MRLVDWLKERNLTMGEFADEIGVDRTTVGRWLGPASDGKVTRPGWEQMSRIAAATGGKVMPNDFLDFLPDPPPGAGCELRRAG